MTSITQLLSPWPITKNKIVICEQVMAQPLPSPLDRPDPMSQTTPPAHHDNGNNDPQSGSVDSDGGETNMVDGRKGYGKRELSTSKRAAQNRAAQRAFRQRKEGYIKKLEEQVRDYQTLSESYKMMQTENHQLRDYIINLQSRLLESQSEVPPPPSSVDGLQPGKPLLPSIQSAGTLPRLSELGAVGKASDISMSGMQTTPPLSAEISRPAGGYPDPSYHEPPPPSSSSNSMSKRVRADSSDMTPAQAALQGASVLNHRSFAHDLQRATND